MADKPNKPQKLKARLPRGLADRGPAEIAATRDMVEKIRLQFERYGFEPLETPAIEYTDALGKFLPDQDRPNEGVFSFQDDDEQWLSLRYDLTAPLARYVAENYQNLALPYRSYRYGYVYRNEKPGPGRYRQFMQFDADTVGSASMAADAEMCMLAADTMKELEIPSGAYAVKVNNRKILDGLLEAIGLGSEANAGRRLTVLRAIDKFDRLGIDGVKKLLGEGRKDESGDFTKGAGLGDEQIERVLTCLRPIYGHAQRRDDVDRPYDDMEWIPVPGLKDLRFIDNFGTLVYLSQAGLGETGKRGIEELQEIATLCDQAGYGSRRIKIDPSIVRGLEYYTGPVYEIELLIHAPDEKGRSVRFGSVGGGGRYDGLVSRFMGQPVPATGFSIGVSRLQAALAALDKSGKKAAPGPVVVTVFPGTEISDCQKFVTMLRNAGIRAELYLGNPKHPVGQQLKYADRRGSPCAVIQGPDEKKDKKITIRDLIAGAGLAGDAKARDDYLKQQAGAQVTVPEAQLVEAVRQLLARHGLA